MIEYLMVAAAFFGGGLVCGIPLGRSWQRARHIEELQAFNRRMDNLGREMELEESYKKYRRGGL